MLHLLDWQNLVFLAPFAAGALMILLSAMSGLHGAGHGGHSAHAHAGHRLGHAGHAHAAHAHVAAPHAASEAAHGHGVTHGHTQTHSGSHTHTHTHTHSHTQSAERDRSLPAARVPAPRLTVAAILMGRAPLPILLWGFLLGWGFCGFWTNQLLHPPIELAMAIAGVGGVLIGRGTGEVAGRLIPEEESSAVGHEALLLRVGTAIFPVTETTGRVHVYDDFGTLHEEPCRLESGHDPIARGDRVLLSDYDEQRRLFLVERA